ncbi:uncharacterized protein LOC121768296 [Salvia splendens]|uniref:uncharacterized protein LOC121768296 n=1 Tax=Salvia splendens TaxID=180675 RepID=UPI001C26EBA8|nr:uncharacterized protein LOC121768296 [Salvia splendens]
MDMLAKQMSQIATSLNEMRGNEGRIHALVKPPNRANISPITLRLGREYKGLTMKADKQGPTVMSKETEGTVQQKGNTETGETRAEDDPTFLNPETEVQNEEVRKETGGFFKGDSSKTVKSFPYRGEGRKRKDDPVDFLEIFGKLEINLPFLQALKLALFSKFIKEFIAGKTKPDGKIMIGENISAVIQKMRLPSKRTGLGMFTLLIEIGNVKVDHAMCDLGASINVLPLSLYKKLVGVRLVDTKIVIQLADRSCISQEGVLKNVIVKVHDFLYPADFHVIKMSEHESAESSGVLLSRPFLRTAKTIIDVFNGTICLDYHGEKFTFNIDEAMKKPLDVENLHAVGIINPLVQEYLETELMQE